MKTWKSKRTVVRSRKSGHFAAKGWGKAFKKQKIKYHLFGKLFD
ncbi:MAG: hypothetical protein WCS42_08420 [Verrucomicrobiota bacterium]